VNKVPSWLMAILKSKRFVAILKYAIAIVLLGFIIASNWSSLADLFSRQPQFEYFAIAMICMIITTSLQYFRWFFLVRALDLPFTMWNAFRLGLVGTFYNSFLPGSIGGDFVKAYLIAKGQPSRQAAAVSTVIADRVLGLFGLILFGAVVGSFSWLKGNERFLASSTLQTITLISVALSLMFIVGYTFLNLLPDALGERLRRFKKSLGDVWDAAKRYRERPGTILKCITLSAISHTAMMFAYFFALRVFPPEDATLVATLPETFTIAPLGFIAQALIPVPGGLGAGELTFGGLYALVRPGASAVGLAGRLTLRLLEWIIGLVGYIAYLNTKSEIPSEEAVTSAA
jgi:glycosyltransferase 2 family protein